MSLDNRWQEPHIDQNHKKASPVTVNRNRVFKYVVIENIITMASTVAVVCTTLLVTGSLHSLWGLLILLNMTYVK